MIIFQRAAAAEHPEAPGGIASIRSGSARISPDRRAVVIPHRWLFDSFIEGVVRLRDTGCRGRPADGGGRFSGAVGGDVRAIIRVDAGPFGAVGKAIDR